MERAIVRFVFDHPVRDARHLGCHRGECLPLQICIRWIGLGVPRVLVAKAVFSHSNRDRRGGGVVPEKPWGEVRYERGDRTD